MTRLMECLEAKEGVEAQYAGVYILKWRSEWGPPEYLFREVDDSVVDDLLAACKAALTWFEDDWLAEIIPGSDVSDVTELVASCPGLVDDIAMIDSIRAAIANATAGLIDGRERMG